MRTRSNMWWRVSSAVILLALLAWPAAVRGQGPPSGDAPRQAHYQDGPCPMLPAAAPFIFDDQSVHAGFELCNQITL